MKGVGHSPNLGATTFHAEAGHARPHLARARHRADVFRGPGGPGPVGGRRRRRDEGIARPEITGAAIRSGRGEGGRVGRGRVGDGRRCGRLVATGDQQRGSQSGQHQPPSRSIPLQHGDENATSSYHWEARPPGSAPGGDPAHALVNGSSQRARTPPHPGPAATRPPNPIGAAGKSHRLAASAGGGRVRVCATARGGRPSPGAQTHRPLPGSRGEVKSVADSCLHRVLQSIVCPSATAARESRPAASKSFALARGLPRERERERVCVAQGRASGSFFAACARSRAAGPPT